MNNFTLFRLKKAGLSNLQLLKVLAYESTSQRNLSDRDRIVASTHPKAYEVLQRYKQQDLAHLETEFRQYPSFSILDEEYPKELLEIYNPPVLLFYSGNLELLKRRKLAVVGARDVSPVGRESIKKIIKECQQEFVIVSGLAFGADTYAHRAALKYETPTIAIIGNGLDTYYPRMNEKLQEYMKKHELVISEYAVGEKPLRWHFPDRNRIIAGISQGVVVVEAREQSGSLITCERAMEEGREVFVVPGNIIDHRSDGCIKLIQEGAKCIKSGDDIQDELIKDELIKY